MPVAIDVYVEDPTTALLTYNTVRLWRDTTPDGAFSTLATTTPLVALQRLYALLDASAVPGSLFRSTLYHSGTAAETPLGPVIPAAATTMLRLRLEAAREVGQAFQAACSALGSTTTLIDAALRDTGFDEHFLEGNWIYRPNAAAADRLRRIAVGGFDITTGTLTVTRAWGVAPANAETYQVFGIAPPIDWPGEPYSWDRAIREGLANVWYQDQIYLGTGDTLGKTRFDLSPYSGYLTEEDIFKAWRRVTDTNGNIDDQDADNNGSWWRTVRNGPGSLAVDVFPPPSTSELVVLDVNRQFERLYVDGDYQTGPFELARKAVTHRFYEGMNAIHNGQYSGELAAAQAAFQREYAKWRPGMTVRGV